MAKQVQAAQHDMALCPKDLEQKAVLADSRLKKKKKNLTLVTNYYLPDHCIKSHSVQEVT